MLIGRRQSYTHTGRDHDRVQAELDEIESNTSWLLIGCISPNAVQTGFEEITPHRSPRGE